MKIMITTFSANSVDKTIIIHKLLCLRNVQEKPSDQEWDKVPVGNTYLTSLFLMHMETQINYFVPSNLKCKQSRKLISTTVNLCSERCNYIICLLTSVRRQHPNSDYRNSHLHDICSITDCFLSTRKKNFLFNSLSWPISSVSSHSRSQLQHFFQ